MLFFSFDVSQHLSYVYLIELDLSFWMSPSLPAPPTPITYTIDWGARPPVRARRQAHWTSWSKDPRGRWGGFVQDVSRFPPELQRGLKNKADWIGGPNFSDSPKSTMNGKRGVLGMLGSSPIRSQRRSDSSWGGTRLWRFAPTISVSLSSRRREQSVSEGRS